MTEAPSKHPYVAKKEGHPLTPEQEAAYWEWRQEQHLKREKVDAPFRRSQMLANVNMSHCSLCHCDDVWCINYDFGEWDGFEVCLYCMFDIFNEGMTRECET